MNFGELNDRLQELIEEMESECELVPAGSIGLDPRCGQLLIGEDFVASQTPRRVDYYGGFEYISENHISSLGPWKLYSRDADRVNELECWE